MKKKLLLLLTFVSFISHAQETQFYNALLSSNSTSGNSRAPQGAQRYSRTVYLITPAELAASGLVNSDVINAIGFSYSTAQNIATTGNYTVYMQNTTDITNLKSNTWATAITGMTTVSNTTLTIPAATGQFNHMFSGGSPFTYSGGGVYIAFEYQNASGAIATTPNLARCSTTLSAGLKSAQSLDSAPTTLSNSNFRPQTFLGKNVVCASPNGVETSLITENSAQVSFTGAGTNYSIQYGVAGFTIGTGTIYNSISTPYVIAGINSETNYSFYIKKSCTSLDESLWAGPFNFTTLFSAAVPPYSYGFESNQDWSILNAGTGSNWVFYSQGGPIPTAAEGTAYAGYNFNSANAANAWLFSRRLALTAGTAYAIKFKYRIADGTVYPENFRVTMGLDKTVVAQSNVLQTYNSVVFQVWTQADLTFTPTASGDHYLGFHCFSTADQNRLAIDDFEITTVLSADSFQSNSFTMYPNPVLDILNVNSNLLEIKSITIADINGRIVKQILELNKQTSQINVSNLNAGIYIVTIDSEEGSTVKKFIKN